jgi:hypothetical protein
MARGEQVLGGRVVDQAFDTGQERVGRWPGGPDVVAEGDEQAGHGVGFVALGAPDVRSAGGVGRRGVVHVWFRAQVGGRGFQA